LIPVAIILPEVLGHSVLFIALFPCTLCQV
jgi:hypothetical protein